MADGVRRHRRSDGRDTLMCSACAPALLGNGNGDGNGKYLARFSSEGLWLFCRQHDCHSERLASWSLLATTMVGYVGPLHALALVTPAPVIVSARADE